MGNIILYDSDNYSPILNEEWAKEIKEHYAEECNDNEMEHRVQQEMEINQEEDFNNVVNKINKCVGNCLVYYPTKYHIVSYSALVDFQSNLIGGYQWYFYNHPNFSLGVRAKGYLGYGYGKYTLRDNGENYYYHSGNQIIIGSELQILWDFLNIDKHSLGIHFSPIGFDVNVLIDNKSYERNDGGTNRGKNTDVSTTSSYTISTGIHYYYATNHQLFLDYKYLANGSGYEDYYVLARRHLFLLGYSYKF